jgi:hypothetical protein
MTMHNVSSGVPDGGMPAGRVIAFRQGGFTASSRVVGANPNHSK